MPQIRLDLPDSISKDVLEKDLSYYFGGDAEIVRQKVSHPKLVKMLATCSDVVQGEPLCHRQL